MLAAFDRVSGGIYREFRAGAGVIRPASKGAAMFVRKKRGSAARRKPKSKAKSKAPRGRLHLPHSLEQRHLDLIGLFLIAAGVYLSFVLFFGWEGGKVGYGLETALVYLVGGVGARIFTALMLVIGGLLVTGTSISTLVRGIGRGLRRVFLGSRGAAQTAIQTRRDRQSEEKTFAFETAGPTDVMSTYPDEEEVEPTVALVEEPDEPEQEAVTQDFDQELAAIEAEEDAAVADEEPVVEQIALTPQGNKRGVTTAEEIDYRPPPAKALERGKADKGVDPRDQEAVARKLVEALGHFGVEAKIVGIVSGPHVSRYELRLAPGTKVKKVTELSNDLAYALASTDIRILAPIPGKQAVGVEVPNTRRRIVRLGDIYAGRPEKTSPLVAWLGKGIDGNAVWTDLAKMPHVLVAGTTGSGKSGCVNAILSSILMQASPNDVRLVLVDPKQVELNHYENVPHLLTPVVTSPRLAANVLANLIGEMESRYGIMGEARARNLGELNRVRAKAGEPQLPHILCVIDELADLMMVSPAEVEDSIIRLAQKSRATGIHLVLATQRPSTDIITGTIKVNIPARIAFAVSSQTDSRVILDQGGAEALLGQGDMLFRGAGTSKLQRIQGAFITEDEIARITKHWAKQGEPEFEAELLEVVEEKGVETEGDYDPDSDDLLDEAIRIVVETETASVSMIQRRLRVGYTRAGRLIDMLERRGVISGYEGSKPRQVLVTAADLARLTGGGGERQATAAEPPAAVPE
jgi:DNA segregation ATPase FtsK/SpoIIIE, S-DNA-T family